MHLHIFLMRQRGATRQICACFDFANNVAIESEWFLSYFTSLVGWLFMHNLKRILKFWLLVLIIKRFGWWETQNLIFVCVFFPKSMNFFRLVHNPPKISYFLSIHYQIFSMTPCLCRCSQHLSSVKILAHKQLHHLQVKNICCWKNN